MEEKCPKCGSFLQETTEEKAESYSFPTTVQIEYYKECTNINCDYKSYEGSEGGIQV